MQSSYKEDVWIKLQTLEEARQEQSVALRRLETGDGVVREAQAASQESAAVLGKICIEHLLLFIIIYNLDLDCQIIEHSTTEMRNISI